MFRRIQSMLIGLMTVLCAVSAEHSLAAPASWGKLAPGPYAVGFRSLWQLDYSRVYNTTFDDKTTYATGKAPRPILINLWYPAERPDDVKPMPYREYFKIETEDPRLTRFAAKLAEYERNTLTVEVMGKAITGLNADESRRLDRLWSAPTACLRDAPPLDARFPLVIYHSGAGSSLEDNAVFCEFLASHGYVVLGSAFQEVTGRTLAVDGHDGSMRDLEFLIAHARRQPNVDWQKIGLVGHSLGAQAVLMFRAQAASAVDAVVSLDTTQDYQPLTSTGWGDMTRLMLANSRYVTGPILMVANARALFQLADSLDRAERFYFTLSDQGHHAFIGQGIERLALETETKPDDHELRLAHEKAMAGYEAVCTYALEFFDAYLKDRTTRREQLITRFRDTRIGGPRPHVEYLHVSATGPAPYRDESNDPPALRQIRLILTRRGTFATVALLRRWREKEPDAAIFIDDHGFALVSECLGYGRIEDAIALNQSYFSFEPKFSRIFARSGESCRKAGDRSLAHDFLEYACLLDPNDAESAARLKELTEFYNN